MKLMSNGSYLPEHIPLPLHPCTLQELQGSNSPKLNYLCALQSRLGIELVEIPDVADCKWTEKVTPSAGVATSLTSTANPQQKKTCVEDGTCIPFKQGSSLSLHRSPKQQHRHTLFIPKEGEHCDGRHAAFTFWRKLFSQAIFCLHRFVINFLLLLTRISFWQD